MDPHEIEKRIAALEDEVAALKLLLVASPPAAKKKRATQLPDDWQPKRTDVAKLVQSFPNVDIPHETDSFRDYWTSRGETRADWDAAYRNWIRKAASFAKAPIARLPARPQGRAAAIGESNRARVDSALDKLHALQQGAGARTSKA